MRGVGLVCIGDAELLDFLAFELGQLGAKSLFVQLVVGFDSPVFLRVEGFDFEFAFYDQAQRRALHPTGGKPAANLAPE